MQRYQMHLSVSKCQLDYLCPCFLRLVNYYDSARANPCWLYFIILFLFLLFLFLLLLLVKSHSIPFFPHTWISRIIKRHRQTRHQRTRIAAIQSLSPADEKPGTRLRSDLTPQRLGGSFGWGWHEMAMFGGISIGSNRFGDWLLRLRSPFLF